MSETINSVFGQISTMQTLLENFPMNIFNGNGKTYDTMFDLIIDILYACGIDTSEIIITLLEKIYGVDGLVGSTIDGLLDRVRYGNFDINTQNPFMEGLEVAIKTILMGLFTSIFTCSALPILPNYIFDYDSKTSQSSQPFMPIGIANSLRGLDIPISLIDFIGMLNISPTSYDGHLYYLTDGRDRYYKKTEYFKEDIVNVEKTLYPGDIYKKQVKKYDSEIAIGITLNEQNDGTEIIYSLYDYEAFLNNGTIIPKQSINDLTIETIVMNNGIIESVYNTLNENDTFVKTDKFNDIKKIVGVIFNGRVKDGTCSYIVNNDVKIAHIFLCSDQNFTNLNGVESSGIEFGESKIEDEYITKTFTATTTMTEIVTEKVSSVTLTYEEIKEKQIPKGQNPKRLTYMPSVVKESSPEYIVYFNGNNPNILYRSYDMNAFIWYAINRGSNSNQIGKNQMMWDSRIYGSKNSVERNSNEEWNAWYNSKPIDGDEFKFHGDSQSDYIYPVIQLEPSHNGRDFLHISIPSQRYFRPRSRERIENGGEPISSLIAINSTIYHYDWEYLKNIKILNPKILLTRLIQNLFGIILDESNKFHLNVTEQLIRGKLYSAIENIINYSDMETENCYMTFSNEDFDDLLNDMLLQRYSAYYNSYGNATKIDKNDIINLIDDVNENVALDGTTSSMLKLVSDVYKQNDEFNIGIDFEAKINKNLLNKLLFSITMPIIESLFTPQVMLLVIINFELLGITRLDEFWGQNLGIIVNLLLNKILGLIKSIVLYIKDKIIEILLQLFYKYVNPLIQRWLNMLLLERLEYWLKILYDALNTLAFFLNSNVKNKSLSLIDNVDYADIVTYQNVPLSNNNC